MDGINQLGLPTSTLERVNCCRLYLRVDTLSDISTLTGDKIDRKAWLGTGRMPSSNNDWPVQPRPHDKYWSLWRKALSDSACTKEQRYVMASKPGALTQPLGSWLHAANPQQSPRWTAYFEHSTQRLFVPTQDSPDRYYQLSTGNSLEQHFAHFDMNQTQRRSIPALALPVDAVPVRTTRNGSVLRIIRTNTPARVRPEPSQPPITSFLEFVQSLPRWKKELLAGASIPAERDKLGQYLLSGKRLLFCSDGGAKSHDGSFGWIIATDKEFLWECHGTAPGWFTNSFRSEGMGQLALLVFLDAYLEYHQLQDITIPTFPSGSDPWLRIATDNQGLISRIKSGLATKTVFAGAALSPEYDVVNEILDTVKRLTLTVVWEHVKGHQDDTKKWYELTRMETLNVRADQLATYGLEQIVSPEKVIQQIPSSKVALIVRDTTITSHYATHLRKAATRPAMLQRFHKHYKWTEQTTDSVDWKAHHGAIQKLRFAEKKFVTKYIHQLLPIGDVFHKIDPTQSATCSSCQTHTESEAHLIQCPQRRDAMEYFMNVTLTQFLETHHTCPELGWCLSSILSSQIRGIEPRFGKSHGSNKPGIRELLQTQHEIGWAQLFQGRFAKGWSRLQDEFLDDNNYHLKLDRKYHSGDIWLRKLIALLWTTVRACWDHRNSSRHGTNKEENHAIRRAKLLLSIQALYKEAPLMLASDRDTLAKPIDDRMKQSPTGLELWFRRTINIAKLSKNDALAALKKTHKTLTAYFRPKPTPVQEQSQESRPD
jgi:hypothetical protein